MSSSHHNKRRKVTFNKLTFELRLCLKEFLNKNWLDRTFKFSSTKKPNLADLLTIKSLFLPFLSFVFACDTFCDDGGCSNESDSCSDDACDCIDDVDGYTDGVNVSISDKLGGSFLIHAGFAIFGFRFYDCLQFLVSLYNKNSIRMKQSKIFMMGPFINVLKWLIQCCYETLNSPYFTFD
ncbi:hypothetical protein BpHYR1_051946 [Brachionus plicatilis]|uniref:Uncharacterized protein n=1 Tax=Brachionus plicatilis TaxID=10195 RepID=A0A3M7QGR5_BRAPC|nr:hypothetical protein BpHYR1_051946 [Brachionus plicatilis]